jgi:hypothetical protein
MHTLQSVVVENYAKKNNIVWLHVTKNGSYLLYFLCPTLWVVLIFLAA